MKTDAEIITELRETLNWVKLILGVGLCGGSCEGCEEDVAQVIAAITQVLT